MDTGATDTMLPARTLKSLGVVPDREALVEFADGRRVSRGIGVAEVRYGSRWTPTWVLFGQPGDASVLGAITLQELGLEVDPRSERLRPVKVVLMVTAKVGTKGRRFPIAG